MAFQTPKTDWEVNPTNPVPADFNRIEGNIDFLNTDIETKKGLIVDAINTMGRTVTIANTHAELATAIKDISDDADALVGDTLAPKTFYQGGTKKTGTMPDRGNVNMTLDVQGEEYIIPAGKHGGTGKVTATFPNLIAENVKRGVIAGGVTGTYETCERAHVIITGSGSSFINGLDFYLYRQVGGHWNPIVYHVDNGTAGISLTAITVNGVAKTLAYYDTDQESDAGRMAYWVLADTLVSDGDEVVLTSQWN